MRFNDATVLNQGSSMAKSRDELQKLLDSLDQRMPSLMQANPRD